MFCKNFIDITCEIEQLEKLEQLRAVWLVSIGVMTWSKALHGGVDISKDVKRVRKIMGENGDK